MSSVPLSVLHAELTWLRVGRPQVPGRDDGDRQRGQPDGEPRGCRPSDDRRGGAVRGSHVTRHLYDLQVWTLSRPSCCTAPRAEFATSGVAWVIGIGDLKDIAMVVVRASVG